ncbi:MAG: hypothetical protein ACI8TX_000407, partial [Hyphomicrobiaceae bacterium]
NSKLIVAVKPAPTGQHQRRTANHGHAPDILVDGNYVIGRWNRNAGMLE